MFFLHSVPNLVQQPKLVACVPWSQCLVSLQPWLSWTLYSSLATHCTLQKLGSSCLSREAIWKENFNRTCSQFLDASAVQPAENQKWILSSESCLFPLSISRSFRSTMPDVENDQKTSHSTQSLTVSLSNNQFRNSWKAFYIQSNLIYFVIVQTPGYK